MYEYEYQYKHEPIFLFAIPREVDMNGHRQFAHKQRIDTALTA